MAAQEYYNPASTAQRPPPPPGPPPMQQPPPPLAPPQHAPRPSSQGPATPPYPMSDAPPPYQAFHDQQRPQSQPPMQRIPQQTGYVPYNPNPQQNGNTHQYPPEKVPQRPSTLQNMYRPSDFTSSHPPQQSLPQQQPNGYAQSVSGTSGYFAPAGPGLSSLGQVYGSQQLKPPRRSSTSGYPSATSPYRRSSRSRSRSRSRERKYRHNRDRAPTADRKKSSVNTFLGAGGGALIGDLIFPGLGTIGGAILGGVGGHEYSKKRPSSTPSRVHNRRSGGSNSGDYYEEDSRRGRKY